MIKRDDKSGSGSSPTITSIKTRVSNNNPYSTIIATLVPLQTTKQQFMQSQTNLLTFHLKHYHYHTECRYHSTFQHTIHHYSHS